VSPGRIDIPVQVIVGARERRESKPKSSFGMRGMCAEAQAIGPIKNPVEMDMRLTDVSDQPALRRAKVSAG
jgi:hypothetical protein